MQDKTFNIIVGDFNGPLESLLEMIQKRKMHISDVSLAKIANDYVAYVKTLDGVPSAEVANFIVVAATLLLIKSKSLLPNLELTMEEEESIKDLEERLGLYNIYKYANDVLKLHTKDTNKLYAPKTIKIDKTIFAPPSDLNIGGISEVMQDVLDQLPKKHKKHDVEVEEKVNIEDVMQNLLQRVEGNAELNFSSISGGDKQDVIVNFLALLELIKDGVLLAQQSNTYGQITIGK